jgi:type IV pilus assembly protein PilQ
MDRRTSLAGFHWPRLLMFASAAVVLLTCAAVMAEVQPAAAAAVVAAPAAPTQAPALEPLRVAAAMPPQPPRAPHGPVEVTGVNAQPAGTGGLVILVNADGPIPSFESFTLPDPPRLVVDIPNAVHAIPQPIAAHLPLVTAIRSSQYREQPLKIVRLVFDLQSVQPYQVGIVGDQLRVALGTAAPAPAAAQARGVQAPVPPPSTPAVTAAAATSAGRVTRVDLQSVRGRQRIVIGTRGRVNVKVTESAAPPALLVDVMDAEIDPAAARSLDLRQVASPVRRLQATQYQTEPQQVVRVEADLRGPIRYDMHQTASAVVVDLLASAARVAAAAPPAAPAPIPAPGLAAPAAMPAPAPGTPAAAPAAAPGAGRLSLDFKDADINNLLRIIAEVSGMNVVAGGDVHGKVTVRLVNVEWQQALDVILKINNMGYEMDGNVIRVAPEAKLATERKARDDAKKREDDLRRQTAKTEVELEPLQTEVIAVNYAKASEMVKNLDRLKTVGRPDANITVDERTNKLIVKEARGTLDRMKKLLAELDKPTPQVLIEARLIEATRNFSQSLGVEYGFVSNSTVRVSNGSLTPLSVFSSPVGSAISIPGSTPPVPLSISFPAIGNSPVGIGFSLGGPNSIGLLSARLSAAESEGRIRTLSAPKVATLDNQQAEIRQGTQVPYTTVDSSGRTVVAFLDAFIRLNVTPHITNDRRVSMKVEAERSFPGDQVNFSGGFVFPINTRKATTNVLVSNGATIVIGGLMQTDESVSEQGIPWLMRVPILGALFKSHSGSNNRNELLIFLTPTILEEPRLS